MSPASDTDRNSNDDAFTLLRRTMIERQLKGRGIDDPRVLAAMERVAREQFVLPDQQRNAYQDSALGIKHGQTISQPYTVAMMAAAAKLTGDEKVLEIGTGSGYGAAVLAELAREVHSIERIEELAKESQERLTRLGYLNVTVHIGDGSLGLPSEAPFDAIVVTAGGPELPAALVEQLEPGGRIVMPIGTSRASQQMKRFTATEHGLKAEDLGNFAFVPLIGQDAWPGE